MQYKRVWLVSHYVRFSDSYSYSVCQVKQAISVQCILYGRLCSSWKKNLRDKLYVKYCMFSCLLCVWNSLFLSGVFNIHGILINILLDVETRLSLVITVDMPDPHNTMPNERILNVNSKIAAVFFVHNPNVLTF